VIELFLPVEWEVVEVFIGENFAEETWAPEAAVNDLWLGRLNDRGLEGVVPRDKFGTYRALDVEVTGLFL
jgi:hypothetical protein